MLLLQPRWPQRCLSICLRMKFRFLARAYQAHPSSAAGLCTLCKRCPVSGLCVRLFHSLLDCVLAPPAPSFLLFMSWSLKSFLFALVFILSGCSLMNIFFLVLLTVWNSFLRVLVCHPHQMVSSQWTKMGMVAYLLILFLARCRCSVNMCCC